MGAWGKGRGKDETEGEREGEADGGRKELAKIYQILKDSAALSWSDIAGAAVDRRSVSSSSDGPAIDWGAMRNVDCVVPAAGEHDLELESMDSWSSAEESFVGWARHASPCSLDRRWNRQLAHDAFRSDCLDRFSSAFCYRLCCRSFVQSSLPFCEASDPPAVDSMFSDAFLHLGRTLGSPLGSLRHYHLRSLSSPVVRVLISCLP